jgi:hypothetical protein
MGRKWVCSGDYKGCLDDAVCEAAKYALRNNTEEDSMKCRGCNSGVLIENRVYCRNHPFTISYRASGIQLWATTKTLSHWPEAKISSLSLIGPTKLTLAAWKPYTTQSLLHTFFPNFTNVYPCVPRTLLAEKHNNNRYFNLKHLKIYIGKSAKPHPPSMKNSRTSPISL